MTRFGISLREDGVEAGDGGIGDEPLRPVEHVLLAVAASRRAHRRRVRARARLGQRVRGEHLAGGETGQEARLLLVRPRELEAERAELLHREDEAARRADLRDLLDRDEREERPGTRPAVLLVEEEPEDAVLAKELDDVPRELVRLVDLGRARGDPLAREGAYELADLELFLGQRLPGHGRILGRRLVADGLDVVAVRVENVGGVVVHVVLRADPGGSVVPATRADGGRVEVVDGLAIGALECHVRAADGVAPPDAEVEPALRRRSRRPRPPPRTRLDTRAAPSTDS